MLGKKLDLFSIQVCDQKCMSNSMRYSMCGKCWHFLHIYCNQNHSSGGCGWGSCLLASKRIQGAKARRRLLEVSSCRRWIRHCLYTACSQSRPMEDIGPFRFLQIRYVWPNGGWEWAVSNQANELSLPLSNVQRWIAIVPWSPNTMGGTRHCVQVCFDCRVLY